MTDLTDFRQSDETMIATQADQIGSEISSYWVVIPAYNEVATVRDVAMRTRQQCANVIVVDDGSTDGTARVLAGLDITLLRNEENLGKAGSLWRGFQHALAQGALGVVTLDADGQHAPEEISLFVETATNDPMAFLIGVRRRAQRKAYFWRYLANRIADFWISWAAGQPIDDTQSGFRLYPAGFLRGLAISHDATRSFVFESEVLIEAGGCGVPIATISIGVTSRLGLRPSHFRPALDIARITRMVAGRLLIRGLHLRGLYRALTGKARCEVRRDEVLKSTGEAAGRVSPSNVSAPAVESHRGRGL